MELLGFSIFACGAIWLIWFIIFRCCSISIMLGRRGAPLLILEQVISFLFESFFWHGAKEMGCLASLLILKPAKSFYLSNLFWHRATISDIFGKIRAHLPPPPIYNAVCDHKCQRLVTWSWHRQKEFHQHCRWRGRGSVYFVLSIVDGWRGDVSKTRLDKWICQIANKMVLPI